MQQASQIDEPDFGMLLDDMFFEDGSNIPADRFILPRLEVELAFVLGKRLEGPHVTLFQVYDAVDYVVPALEIIDARVRHHRRQRRQRRRRHGRTAGEDRRHGPALDRRHPLA
ncbi:hypothetical protein G6F53_014101 [Rhizopus delemar]|nr:hypothetical protein G6F53_014101 [Rhizopus delemar]